MAELVKERHEGTAPDFTGGDEETWTAIVGDGGSRILGNTINVHGDIPGWGNSFRQLVRDGTGWEARQNITFGTPITTAAYAHVEMIVRSEELADGEEVTAWLLNTTGVGLAAQLRLRQAAGSLFWRLRARESGDGGGITTYDGPSITKGTGATNLTRHDILYDLDGARILWYQDGVLQASPTGITPVSQIDTIQLGAGPGDTQKRTVIDYDRILLDDAAWPEYDTPHREDSRSLTIRGAEVGETTVKGTGKLDKHIGADPDILSFALHDMENRVIESDDLDDATAWTTIRSVVGNQVEGPDSADQLAWEIEDDTTAADTHRIQQDGIAMLAGKIFTATTWVRRKQTLPARNIEITLVPSPGHAIRAKFDLGDGTVISTGDVGDGTVDGATITPGPVDPGSGQTWYRVTVTGSFSGANDDLSDVAWISYLLEGGIRTYDGVADSGVVVWNPQLTRGGPDQARFDITTGSDPYQFGPDDLDEVIFHITWKEADGAPWGKVKEFGGHVVEHSRHEITDDEFGRLQLYSFEAAGYARQLGRRRFDTIINDGAVSGALSTIESLVSDDGFSLSVDSADPSIAGDEFAFTPATTMIDEVSRRAGRIWRTNPDKEVSLFIPGTEKVLTILDRDDGPTYAEIPSDADVNWRSDSRKMANSVRVEGDDILVTASDAGSQTEFTLHDAPLFRADGMKSVVDAQRVADSLLDSLKNPILSGTIPTWKHHIDPGQAVVVTDEEQDLDEQEAFVRSVSMSEHEEGGLWVSSLELTTEELLSALGVMTPVPANPRPGDPLPETELFVVNGPIPSPNAAAPTPASDEVLVHLRFDSSTSTWRLEWHTGSGKGGTGAKISANMWFEHEGTMTVTAGTENTEAGENAGVVNDGTRRVRVQTEGATAGKHDFWEIEVGGKDVLTAVPSVVKGTLRVGLFFKDAWTTQIDSITIGDFTVATDVSTGRIIRLVLPVDPSTPLESGSVGSTELADGSVTTPKVGSSAITDAKVSDVGAAKVTEDASREFIHPSYTDTSRRPDTLRHSSGDLTADDAEDTRVRAQTALTASGNVKAATLIGGDAADAASDVEDGAARARTGLQTSGRVAIDILDDTEAITILDISQDVNGRGAVFNVVVGGGANAVVIGSQNAITANETRAGSNRGLSLAASDGVVLAGQPKGGTTGWEDSDGSGPFSIFRDTSVGSQEGVFGIDTGTSGGGGSGDEPPGADFNPA